MKKVVIIIVICALVILFDKWLFEGVMSSNMPDWVKYLILS